MISGFFRGIFCYRWDLNCYIFKIQFLSHFEVYAACGAVHVGMSAVDGYVMLYSAGNYALLVGATYNLF